MANTSKVRLLQAQSDLIEAIDIRYDVSTVNIDTIKVSLPLQPSSWKQLTVDAVEELFANSGVDDFIKDLEQKQIKRLLELLGFVNNPMIGSGEMAIKAKGYRRTGSDVVVKLIKAPGTAKGPVERVFSFAVVTPRVHSVGPQRPPKSCSTPWRKQANEKSRSDRFKAAGDEAF